MTFYAFCIYSINEMVSAIVQFLMHSTLQISLTTLFHISNSVKLIILSSEINYILQKLT